MALLCLIFRHSFEISLNSLFVIPSKSAEQPYHSFEISLIFLVTQTSSVGQLG